ncbi:MAG TPA: hypothetical protein VEJ67_01905 [Candidatus Cybelea sp.]|nr:hypothetical protein [Candidatus Cybelea sp.]
MNDRTAQNSTNEARRPVAPFAPNFAATGRCGWQRVSTALLACLVLTPTPLFAQGKPEGSVGADASNFAVSQNNRLVFSVPHLKRIKKTVIERDTIAIADFRGREKPIVDPDKFMPAPPPVSYVVSQLDWSPDGRHIAATMTVIPSEVGEREDDDSDSREDQRDREASQKLRLPPNGTRVVCLLDDDGHEVRVAGSKTRFIEQASQGAWLADNQTAVYLSGVGPYKIVRVNPYSGNTSTLFEGKIFDSVAWDPPRNQAFVVGRSLSISGRTALVELDLMRETVRELARLPEFQGQLTVSASGRKVGYFVDGDTIEVRDVANPENAVRVQTGPGKFEFSPDDRRILLKRGPADKSGDLVWVGLGDNSWVPILHDLEFHDFQIAPDGNALVVIDPGKGMLRVYPIR